MINTVVHMIYTVVHMIYTVARRTPVLGTTVIVSHQCPPYWVFCEIEILCRRSIKYGQMMYFTSLKKGVVNTEEKGEMLVTSISFLFHIV